VIIQFNHIIPEPLKELITHEKTDIWNQNLELKPKEKIIVEAHSGKGKSTFLNILFGIRKDFEGDLYFNQEQVSNNPEFKWDTYRKTKVSMVHQGLELFEAFSAWQNVILNNRITGFKSEEDIYAMFKELDIFSLKDRKCQILSFGQKQRVAIIRALCQPFNWLLLDEPFSHLDSALSKTALELILRECSAQNAGVLLTSLDPVDSNLFTRKLIL